MRITSGIFGLHSSYYVIINMNESDLFFLMFQISFIIGFIFASVGFITLLTNLNVLQNSMVSLR